MDNFKNFIGLGNKSGKKGNDKDKKDDKKIIQ